MFLVYHNYLVQEKIRNGQSETIFDEYNNKSIILRSMETDDYWLKPLCRHVGTEKDGNHFITTS